MDRPVGRDRPDINAELERADGQVGVGRHHDPILPWVGGFFDKLSEAPTFYPPWIDRLHLYWLHRLFTEPGRMWKRYTFGAFRFAGLVMRYWLLQ